MNDLEHGRACCERRAWREAYDALKRADWAAPLQGDDLDRLATAACLSGREAVFLQVLERQYRAHEEAGRRERAARCAFWLALTLLLRGQIGQSNAWTARGQRLVEDVDCAERGYLALTVAEQRLREGNADAAAGIAAGAVAIAEAFGDADLMAAARHVEGRALIDQGHIVEGLKRLDETMLAVVGGELFPIMTGLMYCSVIDACRQVHALGRAREWTMAFSRVCDRQPEMIAFSWSCMVHRSEILQLQGAWPDALTEACRACERAQRAGRKPPGAAFYQQAEIHRLRGEYAKAEEAYETASERGCDPQPGLALLWLAQGRTGAACAAIRRLIDTTGDRLRRARFLPAYLEIMLGMGDIDAARAACDELRELARSFDSDVLRAVVAQTDGAIALAGHDARASLDPLRYAFEQWQRLDAPYEAARVRVLLSRACRALGDEETAALEYRVACAELARLGARPELERLEVANRPARDAAGHPLTARELQVLRLVSNGCTNKEIATELGLSERTIDRHVSNILDKLDVPTRAAAAAHAVHRKLF
ncbi:MAG TPA: LuxR C-terminal-related transcriptional regulator [Vicinamibacterales bacterium]